MSENLHSALVERSIVVTRICPQRRLTRSGVRVVAYFDCELPDVGIKVTGCALVRGDRGYSVWPPMVQPVRAGGSGGCFFSDALKDRMAHAAWLSMPR